jgi:hypothetical protein
MTALVLCTTTLAAPVIARAQPASAPAVQPRTEHTGSMYNGNNLTRSPIAPRPDPNRLLPAAGGTTGATGQQSRGAGGTGAGGGEH